MKRFNINVNSGGLRKVRPNNSFNRIVESDHDQPIINIGTKSFDGMNKPKIY